ncbi:exosome complex component rrp45 [Cotesia glomerata]|uniref:Exosome complex component RRP45 n=1 Tax=Cotesia glomerata TaxID=32391 RepID=A0AAV7IQM6_COTGL|nr:exosome complex component rrp45 [Cotesia glomerata]KAH0555462.1 hypothetical protein KQX54_019114 [Cotesia glomerata]
MKEVLITKCEKKFINTALDENIRLDGRKLNEARKLKLHFGSSWGSCLASLGQTRVIANVSCDIQQPKLSRPNEGLLYINVELNPLAAAHFEAGRQSEVGVALTRQLERCFKDSRCLDMESLCIVADKKVWNIRVDINVINHDGNLVDCASIATLAALSHFHRPDVTSTGDDVIIHSFAEKDPLPLTLFHQPVCVSFSTFENGKTIMDPTYIEERLGVTQLTMGLNAYHEFVNLSFADKSSLSKISTDVSASVKSIAANHAINVIKQIRDAVTLDVQTRYKKEPCKINRFKDAISIDKISMFREKMPIKLSQWNTRIKEEEAQKNNLKMDCNDEENDNNDDDDEDNDVEMDESGDEVRKVGLGSAELITKMSTSVGEGIKNSWVSSSDDEDDDGTSANDIETLKVTKVNKVLGEIVLTDSEQEDIL